MPMRTTRCITFIDYVPTQLFQSPSDVGLHAMATLRDADVSRPVRQMIANGGTPASCSFDDLFEGRHGGVESGLWMGSHPMIHLGDVSGGSIGVQELGSIDPPALRHQFGLAPYRSRPAGNPYVSSRELTLNSYHQCLYVVRTVVPYLPMMMPAMAMMT